MILLSVRLDETLVHDLKKKSKLLQVSQTDYIRRAIKRMNAMIDKREKKKRMKEISLRVRKESMKVNAEFSEHEHDPEI